MADEQRKDRVPAIVYPAINEANQGFQNPLSTCGNADALRPGAGQSLDRSSRKEFPVNNEQIVREAYERAEKVDIKGWVESFTSDGTFTDMSIGVTYRGPDGPTGLGKTVEVYAKAFPDMHRELFRFFSIGDIVVVELALQGTHKGPLPTPMGILPPTGRRMDAPCCDVFRIVNGKIQSFDCYPSGTVMFAQLGVLSNIEAAIAHS
jgi:predicted ester cyclase